MSSQAKQDANRANAQHSTGSTSTEGKATSSRNAVNHGLNAQPNTLFAADTEAQNNFSQHIQKLRKDCLPEGSLEEETFRRYAFATFQINRAQALELQAQDRWVNDPDHPKWFSQMERFIKLGALQERRADKSLNELRKLQWQFKAQEGKLATKADKSTTVPAIFVAMALPAATRSSSISTSNSSNCAPTSGARFSPQQE